MIAILVFRRTDSAFLTALTYALTYLPPIAKGPPLFGTVLLGAQFSSARSALVATS